MASLLIIDTNRLHNRSASTSKNRKTKNRKVPFQTNYTYLHNLQLK